VSAFTVRSAEPAVMVALVAPVEEIRAMGWFELRVA